MTALRDDWQVEPTKRCRPSIRTLAGPLAVGILVLPLHHLVGFDLASAKRGGTLAVVVFALGSDRTHRPLLDVDVHLNGTRGAEGVRRSVTTNRNGEALFDDLPSGYYVVHAGKLGYVRMSFGAERHDMPGRPVLVSETASGQRQRIEIVVPPGGSVTGRVLDSQGRPASNVVVSLLEPRFVNGARRLVAAIAAKAAGAVANVSTNAKGEYRLYGIPAGEYGLRAVSRKPTVPGVMWSSEPLVYYPNAADLIAAGRVRIDVGEERSGVDFVLRPVRLVALSGTVAPVPGPSGNAIRVVLLRDGVAQDAVTSTPDGRFTFFGLWAGQYTVWARSVPPGTPMPISDRGHAVWGRMDISVGQSDVTDVKVVLQDGRSFNGNVVIDTVGASGFAPSNAAGVEIALAPVNPVSSVSYLLRVAGLTDSTGEFALSGVTPGKYSLEVIHSGGADRYTAVSAVMSGRDVLGALIDVAPNEPLPAATITLSNRRQEIAGTLEDDEGRHPSGYTVVVFSVDAQYWGQLSARLQLAAPATDGSFWFTDIPPGDYAISVVRGGTADDMADPTFLNQLLPHSIRLRLNTGDRWFRNLRAGSGDLPTPSPLPQRSKTQVSTAWIAR